MDLLPLLLLFPHLAEVAWMVLVEVDPVVVLATGVTAASGVLPVLPDPGNKDRVRDCEKDRVKDGDQGKPTFHVHGTRGLSAS